MNHILACCLLFATLVAPICATGAEPAASGEPDSADAPLARVTEKEVELAIQRAVRFLWSKRSRSGRWIDIEYDPYFRNGVTALVAYTLRSAGESDWDKRFRRTFTRLGKRDEVKSVFARAYTLMLWTTLDPVGNRKVIADDAGFLMGQQHRDGGWGYGQLTEINPDKDWQDNANTQLALLALSRAMNAGADLSRGVWRRAQQQVLSHANPDGGWGYPLVDRPAFADEARGSYGSMTAGGLASLNLIYDQLYLTAQRRFNGRSKARCGEDTEIDRPIRKAMADGWRWMDDHFRVDADPAVPPMPEIDFPTTGLTAYFHAVSRAGVASGRTRIRGREWFADIAGQLVRTQNKNGSWGSVRDTCMGVLALTEGNAPVLINKLRYGSDDRWNNDPRDAANLIRWIGRGAARGATWQIVDIDDPSDDLRSAPILLISGHEAPVLNDAQRTRLGSFLETGGTVLAVSCCGRPSFAAGCDKLFGKLLPGSTLKPLRADHLMWKLGEPLAPGDEILAIDNGCRTRVFVLTRGACCAWHQNLVHDEKRLFAIGEHILRYAAFNRQLYTRLGRTREPTSPTPLVTLDIAKLAIGTAGHAHMQGALSELGHDVTARLGLGLIEKPRVVARDAQRSDVAALWLSGHTFDRPDHNERIALERYLIRGGTLIATACCGSEAFDKGFRSFAAKLSDDAMWARIPPSDPLITGDMAPHSGSSLRGLSMRPLWGTPDPIPANVPELFGLRMNNRWAIVYSPVDVCCGIGHDAGPTCAGYQPRDARMLVGNVLLYAAQQAGKTKDTADAP